MSDTGSETFWVQQLCSTHPTISGLDRLWLGYLLYYCEGEV